MIFGRLDLKGTCGRYVRGHVDWGPETKVIGMHIPSLGTSVPGSYLVGPIGWSLTQKLKVNMGYVLNRKSVVRCLSVV